MLACSIFNVKQLIITLLSIAVFIVGFFLPSKVLANKSITLATSELEPYIGEDLPNHGLVHELVIKAFERVGYQVDIAFYPLARSRYLVETGRVDGMLPSFFDQSLVDSVSYSAPFFGGNVGLMKKKSLTLPKRFSELNSHSSLIQALNNYSIGVVRGANVSPYFDQASHLSKLFVSKDVVNLDLLFSERVDFIAIDKYTAADLMVNHRPHFIGQLDFIPQSFTSKKFHVAFSRKVKNYLQLETDFNKGLAEITADGTLHRILNKHGVLEEKPTNIDKTTLTIGTVSNKDMLVMQGLSTEFEQAYPNIELRWRVLDENTLRKRLLSDFAISDGQFDIMTIGLYESLIWTKNGWLSPITTLPKSYDEKDIFDVVRDKLSYQNQLYALPFYSESSITYYRSDLFDSVGISMPESPTYQQIKEYAARLHKPEEGLYGICLRGKPGWGENIALFTTMVNTHQGAWFNHDWQPTINSFAWKQALTLYKDLLTNYGPPNPTLNGYNENKKLFVDGRCAIWNDATVAAGELFNPVTSKVADYVAVADAPTVKTKTGSRWLWTWALAVPDSSKNKHAAISFITWATSKAYIKTVAKNAGWISVPPGTRKSTYHNKSYQNVAPFADFVLKTIDTVSDVNEREVGKSYSGIQFVEIPEFPAIGRQVGLKISHVIEGKLSIDEALSQSQKIVSEQMIKSKYY